MQPSYLQLGSPVSLILDAVSCHELVDHPSLLLGPTPALASSWVISVPCPNVAFYAFWMHNKQFYASFAPFSHSAVCQALGRVQGSSSEWELLPQQWEGVRQDGGGGTEVRSGALAAGGGKDLLQ